MSVDDDVGEQLADAHFGLVAHVVSTLEEARLLFCDCLSELVNYKVPSLGHKIRECLFFEQMIHKIVPWNALNEPVWFQLESVYEFWFKLLSTPLEFTLNLKKIVRRVLGAVLRRHAW